MPTDPFVPAVLDEEPRQEPNLAPGSHMPPSGSWRADRPGDLGAIQPKGALLGNPGPNVGYAMTLANRARDRLRLEPGESAEDALAIIAALAMKRSATFGRAPTVNDVDFAMELLGYQGDAPEDVRAWRPDVVREAAHDYVVRRAVVDTVGAGLLRLPISELPENLAIVREAMARAAEEAAAADEGVDVDLGELDDVDVEGEWSGQDQPPEGEAAPDATADPA
ncbi:MAG TPA: hypothetical protein VGN59_11270 [Acidimicrobiia bacterium]